MSMLTPRVVVPSRLILISCALLALSGCHRAANVFMQDYNCSKVFEKKIGFQSYRVRGCGVTVTYLCVNARCIKESERRDEATAEPAAVAASAAPPKSEGVVRSKNSKGELALWLKLVPDAANGSALRSASFGAVPLSQPDQLQLRVELQQPCADCQVRLAVDGEAVPLEQPAAATSGNEVAMMLPRSVVESIAISHRAVFRLGKVDWELTNRDRQGLRDLMIRFREERALGDAPASSGAETPSEKL